jgi:hypothetical protein
LARAAPFDREALADRECRPIEHAGPIERAGPIETRLALQISQIRRLSAGFGHALRRNLLNFVDLRELVA